MMREYDDKIRSHQASRNKIYQIKLATINELRVRILDGTNSIGQEILKNVLQTIYIRLAHCQPLNGQQFEHLIH